MLYSEKISIFNLLFNFFTLENEKKKYIYIPLKKTIKYFGSLYLYAKDFLVFLRQSPDILYKIIKFAEKEYLDDSFIYFITNNFYNDIFRNDVISDDFLLLSESLLKDEINNINNINAFKNIMNDSKIFILLNGLKYNIYIKKYFDYILGNIFEKYEKSGDNKKGLIINIDDLYYSSLKNNVDNKNMSYDFTKMKDINIDEYNKSRSFNTNSNGLCNEEIFDNIINYNNFSKKYFVKWSKEKLLELLNNYKNDENMRLYINNKIKLIEKNKTLYSINTLINEFGMSKQYDNLLSNYQKAFDITTKMINDIMERILNTIEFFPYGIKYISKTIYNLLINKFKDDDSKFQIFQYINQFIYINIFKYYFLYPDNNLFLDSIIISQETKINLRKIYDIFKKYISGEFFENSIIYYNCIPFNLFFLENMPKLFQIYVKILDIKLPKLNRVDNKKNNESIYSYSICLNINNLTTILNVIKHNSEHFFKCQETNQKENPENNELEIIYNKLKSNKEIFKSLKEKDNKDNVSINYYVFYEIFYSEELNNSFFKSINNFSKNYQIKEKTINDALIHSKNLMSEILYSIDLFNLKKISNNIDFNNLKTILTELSNYYSLLNSISDINFNDIDEEVEENTNQNNSNYNKKSILPIEWLINSLINYMEKLAIDYKENNYKKFFDSLESDINNSIIKYNFEKPSQIVEKLKNTNKYIREYLNYQKLYKNIIINSKIRDFIKNEKIEVKIKYKCNFKEQIFKIKKDNMNNKSIFSNIFKMPTKNEISIRCLTIYELCNQFPNINLIQNYQDSDNIFSEEVINLQQGISTYFDIIKEYIDNKFLKIDKDIVYLKIQKYLFESIYNKLFQKEQSKQDIIFYSKIRELSWIEPKHINLKNINFDKVLPLTKKYFIILNNEHWPDGKFKIIEKLFEIIKNKLIINNEDKINNDYIQIICEYIIIKNNPEYFLSNLKYLQLFLPENEEGNKNIVYIDILKSCVNNIIKLNFTNFQGISKEEFTKRCFESKNKNVLTPNKKFN